MRNLALSMFIMIMFFGYHPANCQIPVEKIEGSWLGTLDAGGIQLRLVFNLTVANDTSLEATMDSPDQGANGIQLGDVTFQSDSLRIDAPALMGYYLGRVSSDSTIEGQWHQAGRDFKVNLGLQTEKFVLNRPQEPSPPYPYLVEEVTFENVEQGFSLGGTLTIPPGDGPFPAVVLVSGSGSQNRDEELFGHKPFKLLADHLTRQGIIVLRYDDRGVGSSGGTASGSTSLDNVKDAKSAFETLKRYEKVDSLKTGIIGHSEGGMIAMILASEDPDLAFIVSLAGPGVDGKTILLDQSETISRQSGVNELVLADNRIVMGKVYDLMIEYESHASWMTEVEEFVWAHYKGDSDGTLSDDQIEQIINNIGSSIPALSYAWMRYFVMYDPSIYLRSIKCPVLALNGEKDSQVLAQKNIPPIRETLVSSGNQNITALIRPGLNHLFQHCETGLPAEYGVIEETFDPKTLSIISDWILKL